MIKTSTKKKRAEEVGVSNHRHCIICGGVVPSDRNPPVCEGPCEEELTKREKRSRTFNLVWMLMIFGLLAIMMISLFGPAIPKS
ncbi:MAG: DUF2116 family Zn-ribbon domain-containing protein [Candidatus Nezhaarchaeales archaeon]